MPPPQCRLHRNLERVQRRLRPFPSSRLVEAPGQASANFWSVRARLTAPTSDQAIRQPNDLLVTSRPNLGLWRARRAVFLQAISNAFPGVLKA
jgi:hypothetical protein